MLRQWLVDGIGFRSKVETIGTNYPRYCPKTCGVRDIDDKEMSKSGFDEARDGSSIWRQLHDRFMDAAC